MFLATTALEEFWDKSKRILFLGEWCKLYERKKEWKKLDYEVLPYHLDDRKKLYKDYLYVNNLYERVLLQAAGRLNVLHECNYPIRYWRIIIGPWLSNFIEVLFDRFESIKSAERFGRVTETFIAQCPHGFWIQNDYHDFYSLSVKDEYNFYLYSEIIKFNNSLPYKFVEVSDCYKSNAHNPVSGGKAGPKNIFKKICFYWDKSVPARLNKAVFVSPCFAIKNQIKLQLRLKQLPYFGRISDGNLLKIQYDYQLRQRISIDLGTKEFETLLSLLIIEHMPRYYLEGYHDIHKMALDVYPKKPKLIFTAISTYFDELFKFWAAYWTNRGAKLAHTQHAGHYGIWLWSDQEEHECKISDIYYSFGWSHENISKIVPKPSIKLTQLSNLKSSKDGYILLVEGAVPRYLYLMMNATIAASGYEVYFNEQIRFINRLTEKARELLLVRPYMHDFGLSQKKRFKDKVPDVNVYSGQESMYKQLKKSRLFVGTYNATTFLETFAANYPTVLFWNPVN